MSLFPGTPAVHPVPRALVVDDEEAIRSILQRFLSRRGWEVDLADDGDNALAFLESLGAPPKRGYDLIIADMRMERMGGAELHRWLRDHRPEVL
ncbi:MAG: response regulator, partial [Cytophagaceae bacterium]|nr:response regulator [Gemmatimonadaceae bacterium]